MSDSLSSELLAQYKEVFSYFDFDSDGFIDRQELGKAIRSLGHSPTEKDISAFFSEVDQSEHEGKVDFSQFLQMIENQPNSEQVEAQIRDAFRVFDRNNTGFVNAAQIKHAMITIGDKLTVQEADDLLKEAYITADGLINYNEVRLY